MEIIKSGDDSIEISKSVNGYSWSVKVYDSHPSGKSPQQRATEHVDYCEANYPVNVKIKDKT